ncbi:MAG: alpha/beta hydrolase [Gammaproteobacteria bacterium]|nr:alpha/beta hydrolase [Gammaproteobacteria bacterium]
MPVNRSDKVFFDNMQTTAAKNPAPKPFDQMSIDEIRAGLDIFISLAGQKGAINHIESTVTTRDGYSIPIRIYNPEKNGPVFIYYPGCGYICDLFESNAIFASRIAQYADIKVIIPQTRLAPEFPLPKPIEDAFDIFKGVSSNSHKFGVDPNKIIIGGLSSGAHTAACISNLVLTEPHLKIYHQILYNGSYDLSHSTHEYDDYEKEDIMVNPDVVKFFMHKFWGLTEADLKNSSFSPYYSLTYGHLPSTSIIVSEYDGSRNDSESYSKKLRQHGKLANHLVIAGQTHNTALLRKAMSDGEDPAKVIADEITRVLHPGT